MNKKALYLILSSLVSSSCSAFFQENTQYTHHPKIIGFEGHSQELFPSEYASVNIKIIAEGEDHKSAEHKIHKYKEGIYKFLKRNGFKSEEISWEIISSLSGHQEYLYQASGEISQKKVQNYCRLVAIVNIHSENIEHIEKLQSVLRERLRGNEDLFVSRVVYEIRRTRNKKREMYNRAAEDAYNKAKACAKSLGRELRGIFDVSHMLFGPSEFVKNRKFRKRKDFDDSLFPEDNSKDKNYEASLLLNFELDE